MTRHSISKGQVHLWTVRLSATADVRDGLFQTLSPDERERASAFRFEKHRDAYVVGRGLLRAILGQYLRRKPAGIVFQYGPKGKPALADRLAGTLHFNLAHSEDCAVYAIGADCELGVDVEAVRKFDDQEAIAERFFAAGECADLRSLQDGQRSEAFFNCWTRKEAYLKATGDGLSVPLSGFRVSLTPGQPAAFLQLEGDQYPLAQWSLCHLAPRPGFIGALAIPTPHPTLRELAFADAEECLAAL